jgi:putative ABC transport system permease protein
VLKTHLKLAIKVLFRRKFFTAISLFGISFTLVVLTVVAALIDNLVAPIAPETRLGRTLFINYVVLQGERSRSSGAPGWGLLDRCARDLPGVEKVSFFAEPQTVITYKDGEKLAFNLRRTDGAFWEILDFDFVEGGPLTAQDDAKAEPVAVISESTRRRYFGTSSTVLGQTIEVDAQRYRVRGVVRDVALPRRAAVADLWVPNSVTRSTDWKTSFRGGFNAMILATDPSRFAGIKAEFAARLARLELPNPDRYNVAKGSAVTRFEHIATETLGTQPEEKAPVARLIFILVAAGLAFMVLPAINLINLNISRIFERASEIGVRKAFGASALELIGQFVLENLVLSIVGGVLGLAGSVGVLAWLNRVGVIPGAPLSFEPRIFLYALLLSIFFGVLSGIYPAWRMSRLEPVAALKGGGS